MKKFILALLILSIAGICQASELKASWYSVESLKKEGTWKTSKGVMANGEIFNENNLTCATRLYRIGTYLRVWNVQNNKSVVIKVTDRIGKRFANSRIDLSRAAFQRIASLDEGTVPIRVEVVNGTK